MLHRAGRPRSRLRGPLITIPEGLFASDEPYEPEVRRFYWLQRCLLDPEDPEPEAPLW